MEITPKLWEKSKSDQEIQDMFQKIIRVNRVHRRIPSLENLAQKNENERDEFYNFVSIIINPEQDSSVKKMITNIYESIDIHILLSYFYREQKHQFENLNLEAITKLKRLFDQVN